MSKSNHAKPKRVNHDYLPANVGDSFLTELIRVVTELPHRGFKEDYLISEMMSKYCDSTTTPPDVRRQTAITKWLSVEDRNRTTNQRIYLGDADFGWTTSDAIVKHARRFIRSVIGETPPEDIFSSGAHTFGASTRVRRGPQAAFFKHVGEAHVSHSAIGLYCLSFTGSMLAEQPLAVMDSSVMFTVPKNSTIDRVACKEPEVNMLLQRSVGTFIRRALKRKARIDLRDQTINRELAKDALRLDLCTIDLSSASDSITNQLVISLLPVDWWHLLDRIRVHTTDIDGSVHELEMFSSMGNGFTFELESLLFYALTRSICYLSGNKGKISVYGDDIIAPRLAGARIARVFNWFGLLVNTKKSNWTGSFRESCGGHYFRSLDVTPFYVREPIRTKSELIRILNRLMYWDARGWGFMTTVELADFHAKWSQHVPFHLHGGQDPNQIDSLVTGDSPRKRLLWRGEEEPRKELGAYLHWFTTTRSRTADTRTQLELAPARQGRPKVVAQSCWLERTSWTPYLIREMQGVRRDGSPLK